MPSLGFHQRYEHLGLGRLERELGCSVGFPFEPLRLFLELLSWVGFWIPGARRLREPLDELVDRARLRIARSDSELSEKAGLTLLLNRAERLLRDRVAAGDLDPADRATVNELLDAIIASARAYAG